MAVQKDLEVKMDEVFVKNAPFQIPANARKTLVEWSPWIALVFGVLGIFAATALWGLGHTANQIVDYTNNLNQYYGTPASKVPELGVLYYVALLALVAQAALLLIAFPGLRARSKTRGWNLLLFGVVANLVYGVFVAFTDQGSISNLFFSILGTVISLYILAQIRSYYKA